MNKLYISIFRCLLELFVLAKNSSAILNIHGNHRKPGLLPDFSGNALSSPPFGMVWTVGILYITFIILQYVCESLVSPEFLS